MTNIKFSIFSVLIAFFALVSFSSCEKDTLIPEEEMTITPPANSTVTSRNQYLYAVTEAPNSEIIQLEAQGYAYLGNSTLVGAITGDPVPINDLKGILHFYGDYYVTTGPGNPSSYQNALLKIDPATGTVLQHSTSLGSTVSDICFVDIQFGPYFGFVGLDNNSNSLAWINMSGSGAGSWVFSSPKIIPITGLTKGYTASGLTWVRSACTHDFELHITATNPNANKALMYTVDPISGAAQQVQTFIGFPEFQGTHTANGWLYFNPMDVQVGHEQQGGGFNFTAQFYDACPTTSLSPWANPATSTTGTPYEDFCSHPH